MKRNLATFLLKLALGCLLLGYVWFAKLQWVYPSLLDPLANPLFRLLGVKKWLLFSLIFHFANLVPFVALVLATPGVLKQWKKTILVLAAGLGILVAIHLAISVIIYHLYAGYGLASRGGFYWFSIPVYLVNDSLPLVLWLLFYPGKFTELFGFLLKRAIPGFRPSH